MKKFEKHVTVIHLYVFFQDVLSDEFAVIPTRIERIESVTIFRDPKKKRLEFSHSWKYVIISYQIEIPKEI